jgi:hypothetical protein
MAEGCRIDQERVTQGGDEQEHLVPLSLDLNPTLAEVDL